VDAISYLGYADLKKLTFDKLNLCAELLLSVFNSILRFILHTAKGHKNWNQRISPTRDTALLALVLTPYL